MMETTKTYIKETKKEASIISCEIGGSFQELFDLRKKQLLIKRFDQPTQNEIKQIDEVIEYIEGKMRELIEDWSGRVERELKCKYTKEED